MKNVRATQSRHTRDSIIQVSVIALFVVLLAYGAYLLFALTNHSDPVASVTMQSGRQSVLGENSSQTVSFKIEKHEYITQNGLRYLRVYAVVENNTTDIAQFSPLLQLRAVDTSGSVYPFMLTDSTTLTGGPLQSGQTVQGTADFAISATAIPKMLLFRQSPDANDQEIVL